MEICEKCLINKTQYSYENSSTCILCKLENKIERTKKWLLKIQDTTEKFKDLDEFEKITVFKKHRFQVINIPYETFINTYSNIEYMIVGNGEVYLTEFKNPFKEDIYTKQLILERDGFKCQYCGEFARTIDHIYPKSKGGANHYVNYITSCSECNLLKGDTILDNIFQMSELREMKRKKLALKEENKKRHEKNLRRKQDKVNRNKKLIIK